MRRFGYRANTPTLVAGLQQTVEKYTAAGDTLLPKYGFEECRGESTGGRTPTVSHCLAGVWRRLLKANRQQQYSVPFNRRG